MLSLIATIGLAACALQPADPAARPAPAAAQLSAAPLQTIAEKSDYKATAKYDDVKAFIDELAKRSKLVRVSDIGKTGEDRAIPLVIIADPPVASADEARKSGKLVVLAFGNIHGGEVDGKDGLMALMRDVVDDEARRTSLLNRLVLCFVPIYNADGNERFGKDTRPGQVGPEEGQGRRANAAGLDLNRDFVKLEAPETRALLKFINAWDPAVLIDTHTTNGSYHRYPMTYAGPKHPAGDASVIEFGRDKLLPWVAKTVEERHALKTWYYGNFNADKTRWEDYPDEPRYGVNSFGLRNRLGILTESYSYAPFKDRVIAQQQFVGAVLEFAAANHEEIRKLIRDADRATVRAGEQAGAEAPAEGDDTAVAIRSNAVAFDQKVTALGYVEERRDGRTVPTTPKDYEVEHVARWVAERTVPRPAAYIIPMPPPAPGGEGSAAAMAKVVETLQRHGVAVEELREDLELDIEACTIDAVTKATRPFQGHETVTVEATSSAQTRRIPAGSYIIRTNVPLGSLAVFLLEPASTDGLTTWNYFDPWLQVGSEFPVLRLPKAAGMLTVAVDVLPEDRPTPKALTFEVTLDSPPNLNGSPASVTRWIDDETFVQSKGGKSWKVNARTGRSESMPEPDTSKVAEALAKLPTIGERESRRLADRFGSRGGRAPRGGGGGGGGAGGGRADDAEPEGFFFDHENDLYYARYDGTSAVRLTSSPQREELASMSPDGKFVAFVRENDLWVVDVDTRTERALTTGGTDLTRNAKADWVYYEEVFGRNWRTYWWSPDSARIAYLHIDSTPVKTFIIVNNVPGEQVVERAPYPRPGEPNPRASLHVVSVAGGEPRKADLAGYEPETSLITDVGWWPDSANFYAYIQNRTQTWLDMVAFPADGGDRKKLFRETTKAWVDSPGNPTFLKDGSFLLLLERTGWKHVFHFARDGALKKQVTEGEWEARGITKLVEETAGGQLFLTGTRDGHVASNFYRVNLDGSGFTRLTAEAGSHSVSLSPTGKLFTDSWSSPTAPSQLALRSADDGSLLRVLDTNPVRDLAKYTLLPVERVQIPMPDGFLLEATIMLPPDLDPTKKYPVWLQTYAGPHAPTVSDSWSGGRTFEQALAADGIIAFRTDPRSASGKGAVSAWACYKQMGVSELADLEAAVKWLAQRPYVDADRIGIAGHSYGGFMTSYALTHSKAFAAGIAGAPVTDWRDYDTIYTERMMLTPQENPDGYDKTSVVGGAKNLHGRLLLLHGMIDDNVHLANATKLVHALQRANKQFEIMLYPENRHGLGGKHYQQLQIDFIRRTMGGPKPAPSESTEPPQPAAISGP